MSQMNLSAVLSAKRREKGITQEELAAYVGVSKQSVSKWETGSTYPDIVLLPLLASYFNISVDELIGYEPQMTAADIRKLNMELLNDFAGKPFDDVVARCREITKKYFSCFPLLFQIGTLLLNNAYKYGERESVIAEAKELFVRVKTMSDSTELRKLAIHSEAVCEMELGNSINVIELLENEINCSVQPTIPSMLSQSYQTLGKTQEAKAILQDSIVSDVISFIRNMTSYLEVCTGDPRHYEEICNRAEVMIEALNMKKLSPVNVLPFYLAAAKGYMVLGETDKTLDMLEIYTEIATGDIPLQLVKGDGFFTLIDEYREKQLRERPFGMPEIPIDGHQLKQKLAEIIIERPHFAALRENERFQSLTRRLKK